MKVSDLLINSVSETLFVPLYSKALDAASSNPILNDQYSREIIKSIDYDFSKLKGAKLSLVGTCLRAKHLDKAAQDFMLVKQEPVVVCVGCGLDARKKRLGAAAENTMFYEIDLPEVLQLRSQFLPESEHDVFLPGSFLDPAWMEYLNNKHPSASFLFLFEGLLMYFSEEELRPMFARLANTFSDIEIHFDCLNAQLIKKKSVHNLMKKSNVHFKFGGESPAFLEEWEGGFKLVHAMFMCDSTDMRRMGFIPYQLMKIIPLLRDAAWILKYQKKKAAIQVATYKKHVAADTLNSANSLGA